VDIVKMCHREIGFKNLLGSSGLA